jgi:hypothetical protein
MSLSQNRRHSTREKISTIDIINGIIIRTQKEEIPIQKQERRTEDDTLSINQKAEKAMEMMATKEKAIALIELSTKKNAQLAMKMIEQLENNTTNTPTLENIMKNCQKIINILTSMNNDTLKEYNE